MAPRHGNAGFSPGRWKATLRLVGLLLVTQAAAIAFATDWQSPFRAVLVVSFLLFVPGLALAELLELREPVQQLAIAPAASLAIETLVTLALLYAGAFSTRAAFAIVVVLTAAATVMAILRVLMAMLRARRSHISVVDPGSSHVST